MDCVWSVCVNYLKKKPVESGFFCVLEKKQKLSASNCSWMFIAFVSVGYFHSFKSIWFACKHVDDFLLVVQVTVPKSTRNAFYSGIEILIGLPDKFRSVVYKNDLRSALVFSGMNPAVQKRTNANTQTGLECIKIVARLFVFAWAPVTCLSSMGINCWRIKWLASLVQRASSSRSLPQWIKQPFTSLAMGSHWMFET